MPPNNADTLHLGCGTDIHTDAWNVDKLDAEGVDQTMDLDEYPWNLPRNHFKEIRAYHVFEHLEDIRRALVECRRLLSESGQLIIKLPVGQNAWTDPDHEHRWNWDTPEMYCGERPWDADVGLEVVEKDAYIRTHVNWPVNPVYGGCIRLWEQWEGPGRWMFDLPATSGEFTVVFEKS